ncbi:hypothetical protein [Micromonospora sp. NPDC006431]|uniref:hypothetical protein n=1 Tax=Micromonospora sp. NPDC006431 TaxID=3364235 RepID=UPI003686DB76
MRIANRRHTNGRSRHDGVRDRSWSDGHGGVLGYGVAMRVHDGRQVVEQRRLPILVVAAVLAALVSATDRVVGMCIVFRLAKRSIPGCVPVWSADRAPPRVLGIA